MAATHKVKGVINVKDDELARFVSDIATCYKHWPMSRLKFVDYDAHIIWVAPIHDEVSVKGKV